VTVEQDSGQSPEVCVSACADEGKPQFNHLTHVFTLCSEFIIATFCAFTFRN
jgi:hypothetical protein